MVAYLWFLGVVSSTPNFLEPCLPRTPLDTLGILSLSSLTTNNEQRARDNWFFEIYTAESNVRFQSESEYSRYRTSITILQQKHPAWMETWNAEISISSLHSVVEALVATNGSYGKSSRTDNSRKIQRNGTADSFEHHQREI